MLGPTVQDPLSQRVLVLNRIWQAVNIVAARRAFCLLFQDHAKVLHAAREDLRVMSTEEWIAFCRERPLPRDSVAIRTVQCAIHVPKIILLNEYDRLPMKEVKFSRESVFERDRHTCQYCGEKYPEHQLNLDHVIPRDRGGRTTWENIVTSCIHCNTRKANRVPHEARMHLQKKPAKPKWRPFVSYLIGDDPDDTWSSFLKAAGRA